MKSLDELNIIRDRAKIKMKSKKDNTELIRVVVGMATCGIAAGAKPVLDALNDEVSKLGLGNVAVKQTGCIGICQYEPIVEVIEQGKEKVTYVKVNAEKAREIASKHLKDGNVVSKYTVGGTIDSVDDGICSVDDTAFYTKQKRVALRNCGIIDPESIDEYIAVDGFAALGKCLTSLEPDEVVDIVKASGLRGRGGGGFPAGLKWGFTAANKADKKYVVCNADEGDPGAFMDRSVLEGDPYCLIEAMTICGYATGADEGYIYVRAEYPVAVARLEKAIAECNEKNLLGKNIFGSGFEFNLHIRLGAGAFVCGEETALMTSIEGNRGEPRPRPPFPSVKGLFGKPTTENNVETFANIPQIILKGAEWFSGMGTEKSKGTKVFALGGKIMNTGLVEIPMGVTLRETVEEIGGGIPNGKKFKAAQTGGPSGGCIPAEYLDIPMDYDNLLQIGAMMGSGGLIVMDEDNCMVDIAKFFLEFTVDESCGKCTPCRIGTKRLYEILEKITNGDGTLEDLDKMEEICHYIKENSLCGLGQSAPNPVLSTYKHFKDEYIAHVVEKRCPSGVCKNLLSYEIIADKCRGCTACARVCPVDAISGSPKNVHKIDKAKCIKCGACMTRCKFDAIIKK
ncbi:MAG: NADH-quinone oxidoreductase subunit NuoF [Clostridiales bacterium]|jgi:NADP-reducing hydrogenase subunit HndC|nr:NADH-quinone oxidoreductase subunit NuoF [Clostridiales bacterium]